MKNWFQAFAFIKFNLDRYAAGLPFVDRPVTVDTLAAAAVQAVEDPSVSGILDFREMEQLAANAALYI